MTGQVQYRRGDRRVQVALVVLLLVTVVLVFYLQGVVVEVIASVQLLVDLNPQQALIRVSRLWLWLVATAGLLAVVIGFYLCLMSARIARSGVYPPPSMPVAFKTRIRSGSQAQRMRWVCLLLAVILFLQPLLGLAVWYSLTSGVI